MIVLGATVIVRDIALVCESLF